MQKQFYEIAGIRTTNEEWQKCGFNVINFGMVTKIFKEYLTSLEFAEQYREFENAYSFKGTSNNVFWENSKHKFNDNLPKLIDTYNKFQSSVFKEKRGGKNHYSIGWENLNSYLTYHSGIFYKWF